MHSQTDRIQRHIVLKAPISRVWRALSDAEEFGNWFGMVLRGRSMKVGETLEGRCTYPGYEHVIVRMKIERLEAERTLAWRWHPAANDPARDYSAEPMTLVVFELEEVPGGTRLTVTESGLDSIPLERRAHVFRLNTEGWDEQMISIEKHVAAN